LRAPAEDAGEIAGDGRIAVLYTFPAGLGGAHRCNAGSLTTVLGG